VKRKLTLPHVGLAAVRKLAADALFEVAQGRDPGLAKKVEKAKAAGTDSVAAVFERYQSLDGKKLRTAADRNAIVRRLVLPQVGTMQIDALRRGDVIKLLDKVERDNGPVMADRTLAIIRKVLGWHAVRDENYRSPIIRGMARTKPAQLARSRILTDDELRSVWAAASAPGPFPALVKFLLLTGARRNEAARMTWSEVDGADWTLPAARNKVGRDLVRPLSDAALAVLGAQPRIDNCVYIFTSSGRKPLRGFACLKTAFDKRCGVSGWTLHDLRRSAKSLMSRGGVPSDHREQCLGHTITGVRGTYDRHEYYTEKKQAFEALAAQIMRIVDPQDNVTPIRKRG
jgi:integrase